MTPTERFQRARELLIRHRLDQPRACAEFRWPEFPDGFNWAADWFDVMARGNHRPALRIVQTVEGRIAGRIR